MGYTKLLQKREQDIREDLKQEIEASIVKLLKNYSNEEVRNGLYKLFRVPPFVLTRDNELVFIDPLEYN